MLLYVDKKKLKRHKIKIICITLSWILIILANIICFKTALHHTSQTLTTYTTLQKKQDWYNNADIVTIFSEKQNKTIKAIIIPKQINRENVLTIALAFSNLPRRNTRLVFANDAPQKQLLQKLGTIFIQASADETPQNTIIITTDINNVISLINEYKLYPNILNHKQSAKLQSIPSIQQLLNQHFPPRAQPQTPQEQQLHAIQNFANTYHTDLQNLINTSPPTIKFTAQNLILQNLGVCISSADQTACSVEPDNSLQQNIRIALASLNAQIPQKLFLLTTLEEIPANTVLADNDGLFFRYGLKKTFILPQKKAQSSNNTNIYAYLKQQAGLNPDYQSPDMKFYKFKTTEININDNI